VVSLVLSAATRWRGAGRALAVLQEGSGGDPENPSWASTRVGVLRRGYDNLTRATAQGEEWVWLVAQVVQTGPEQC
jgi:hypothetical protein